MKKKCVCEREGREREREWGEREGSTFALIASFSGDINKYCKK